MSQEIDKLHLVWEQSQKTAGENTALPQINFEKIIGSLISTGPFYYYVIDFYDMSLSNVSEAIEEIHGFDPKTVTFNDILDTIHPDDMDFVAKAEAANIEFLFKTLGVDKVLQYKSCFSFRSKMKNGEYALLNHQALILTLDENGGFGKSLNIHTRIDHLAKKNTGQFSLIGLNNLPSYMNIAVNQSKAAIEFSKRELDILRLIAEGNTTNEIASQLYISPLTVKKHRTNILNKSNCKNTSQLIKESILSGLL
ncbi:MULTISPECIES: LuxR C-terminal-related transcriptional regulator [Altibacter]|uniref:LuxR C-terminal-related transcriptional regulator n=1 Tax=Altibacter TaxID=1535231 RepID=UPI000553627E|nr:MULTISPECIES: LuxR C-terminal-related transcriptional regulator [Altibacter]MCW8981182.1 LuxR C-terminal-related transcriptional regulator [Altibacter sp.]MCW9036324.1 LuxR C-terminal-related transcriptional regulator [Altibacter sp.]